MGQNSKVIKIDGIVEEALPGLLFRVRRTVISQEGISEMILAHPAGRLKLNHIRVIPGDRVIVEMANVNDTRGRIVRRL